MFGWWVEVGEPRQQSQHSALYGSSSDKRGRQNTQQKPKLLRQLRVGISQFHSLFLRVLPITLPLVLDRWFLFSLLAASSSQRFKVCSARTSAALVASVRSSCATSLSMLSIRSSFQRDIAHNSPSNRSDLSSSSGHCHSHNEHTNIPL